MFTQDTVKCIYSQSLCGTQPKLNGVQLHRNTKASREIVRGNPSTLKYQLCEDAQPVKPPHTDTVSNLTEMERSQPRNTMLQLLRVLQKRHYAAVI